MSNLACLFICLCIFGGGMIALGGILFTKMVMCKDISECSYDKNGELIYKGNKVSKCYGKPDSTIHCHWEDGKECPVWDDCTTKGYTIIGSIFVTLGILIILIFVGCVIRTK